MAQRWPGLALAGWPAGLVEIGHPANAQASTSTTRLPVIAFWLGALRHRPPGWCATAITHLHRAGGSPAARNVLSEGWAAALARAGRRPAIGRGSGHASGWEVEFSLAGRRPLHPRLRSPSQLFEADAMPWAVPGCQRRPSGRPLPVPKSSGRGRWLWRAEFAEVMGLRLAGGRPVSTDLTGLQPSGQVPWANYNGKFMSFSGCCAAAVSDAAQHARPTYRNSFRRATRWMASGLRWLGRSLRHQFPGAQSSGATGRCPDRSPPVPRSGAGALEASARP